MAYSLSISEQGKEEIWHLRGQACSDLFGLLTSEIAIGKAEQKQKFKPSS
jgi:hypothetical protein